MLSLGTVPAPPVPGHPGHHLAPDLLPPPQHDLLQSRHGLLVQETGWLRGLVGGGLEEPLESRLAGGPGQQFLLHQELSIRSGQQLETSLLITLSQMTLLENDQLSDLDLASEEEWIACTAWEFDTSFWQRTIIMDFDLVCDVSED